MGKVSCNTQAADCIEKIEHAAAAQFAKYLASTGIKSKTRKGLIDDLSTVWQAVRQTHPKIENPWPRVRPQVNDSETGKPFTREQESAILHAAEKAGLGWHLACLLARHTGLRYSSVARLKWEEVDLDIGVIRHTPPKTSRHNIKVSVPLVAALHDALRKARQEAPDAVYVLPLHAQAYTYRRSKSGPGLFATILSEAKVSGDYTFHSWRHTFSTRLSEAGVSDDLAKRLGGWTEDATAARYDHAERVEELRAAVEKAK
jgi:integrase